MFSWRRISNFSGLLLALLLASSSAFAIDMQALMRDTQRTSQSNGQLNLVWWIPFDFWKTSLAANQQLSEQGNATMLKTLQDYTLVALIHAKIGAGGVTDAASMDDLIMNTRLQVGTDIIAPVNPADLNPALSVVVATFKPLLANLLGKIGQSMEVLVYSSPIVNGKYELDPLSAGAMQYTLYDQTYRWRLPLGSLLPKRFDPNTHEEFPGDYLYSPYTGAKLTVQ
jgi:hypothetical protein